MIRAVLATVLAAALLAAALPAIEGARAERTAASMGRTVERVEHAAGDLRTTDAANAGARRVVPVSLPAHSLAAAGVERFAVRCAAACTMSYRLTGNEVRQHRFRAPVATPDGPVRFSTPGTHRLVLGLGRTDDDWAVTVRG